MKKVWSSLVILAILVGMFVCMGAQASAAEGGAEIFAVAGQQPGLDSVAEMQANSPDGIVLGVEGLSNELGNAMYTMVSYVDSDPMMSTGLYYVWPGHAVSFVYDRQTLAIVGVSAASTVEEITGALAELGDYTAEGYYVVAVGPKDASSVVGMAGADVDMFVTSGIDEEMEGDIYQQNLGAVKMVNVGYKAETPASLIEVADNSATASAIPMPAPVADPNVGPAEEGTSDGSGIDNMLAPGLPVSTEGEGAPSGEGEGEGGAGETMTGPGIVQIPNVFTVSFDGNGATGGSMDPVAVTDGSFTFPECGFTRDGYAFQSWVTPDWVDHQPGETITVTEGMTISASWTENASAPVTYDVIYSANAEPHSGIVADAHDLPAGSTHVLEANAYGRDGYDFAGWDVNGTVMHPGDSITVDQDITVRATWTEISQEGGGNDPNEQPTIKSATVTFDPNGGTLVEGENNTQTVEDIGEGKEYGVPDGATMLTAPAEGQTFAGWLAPNDEHVYKPGEEYFLTGDVTLTAQWAATSGTEPGPVVPAPETYKVNYHCGDTVVTDENTYAAGAPVTLKSFETLSFTAPEGKKFTVWTIDDAEYAPGAVYTVQAADVDIVAVFEDLPPVNFVVHFAANGGGGTMADVTVGADSVYTLPGTAFTAPQNKYFSGWLIGETAYKPGYEYTVTAETTLTAQWADLEDAGHVDGMTWTPGDADLSVTYGAPIATITVDKTTLAKDAQYRLSADGKIATILNSYLTSLTAGDHTVVFTFSDTQDGIALAAVYAPETMVLTVKPAPQPTAEPNTTPAPNTTEVTWADRSQNLTIGDVNWTAKPLDLEIDYGASGFKAVDKADYSIGQNADGKPNLTLSNAIINSKYGGPWPNARYGFRITMADGSTWTLKITLQGNIPASATATPTPKGGTSPVTGDTNNIVLYVVLLAVLVLALAVVLIVMVKRRNNGRR